MKWVDVAGPPGCGKSTICYPIWGDRSVTWDGKPPPAYWKPFLDELATLTHLVEDHVNGQTRQPTIQAVLRMCDRSLKKMATVERMDPSITAPGQTTEQTWGKVETQRLAGHSVFIQTGLVQRVLGFGWRLAEMRRDVNLIRTALWRMPVSVGVAFLGADLDTLIARNKAREQDPKTAHENRSHQVPFMLTAIAIAKETLRERGVPVVEIDVQHQSADAARAQLLDFARRAGDTPPVGPRREMAPVPAPHHG